MKDNIFFSIIIPTYNRATFISKAIESVLNQTYQNFELIIVDDGSTDNTEEVVKSLNDNRILYYKKENAERGAARNFGAKKAKGQYLNFFDSDDVAYNNHLFTAFNSIQENNLPEIIHLSYDIKDAINKTIAAALPILNINKQILKKNIFSCNGIFIRKDVFLNNPFCEDRRLSGTEDYLLWLQMVARYSILHFNIVTSTVINHENRSVLLFNENSLLDRTNLLIKYLKEDEVFMRRYKQNINKIYANMLSYVAIHAAIARKKKTALKYFLKSIKTDSLQFFSKRSVAIIKRLIF